jgi:hypothetical protein
MNVFAPTLDLNSCRAARSNSRAPSFPLQRADRKRDHRADEHGAAGSQDDDHRDDADEPESAQLGREGVA